MNNQDFRVGDKVWSYTYGWGVVAIIHTDQNNIRYPVSVDFEKCADLRQFTKEGKKYHGDLNQDVFFDEIKFEIPKKPLPKLKKDTKVLVWNNNTEYRRRRHFSHFSEDGKIITFMNGRTSWTGETSTYGFECYDNWELYEEEKC